MNTYKFKTEIEVSKENIDDIVCMALEGGINYWCNDVEVVNDSRTEEDDCFISELITKGKTLILHNYAENKLHELDLCHVLQGLRLYVQNEGISICADGKMDIFSLDATAADMIIQYGLFGEVIYG